MKRFYKSKTFWMGVAELLAGFTLFVLGELEAGAALTGAGIVTMFLRFLTKEGITFK